MIISVKHWDIRKNTHGETCLIHDQSLRNCTEFVHGNIQPTNWILQKRKTEKRYSKSSFAAPFASSALNRLTRFRHLKHTVRMVPVFLDRSSKATDNALPCWLTREPGQPIVSSKQVFYSSLAKLADDFCHFA